MVENTESLLLRFFRVGVEMIRFLVAFTGPEQILSRRDLSKQAGTPDCGTIVGSTTFPQLLRLAWENRWPGDEGCGSCSKRRDYDDGSSCRACHRQKSTISIPI
jgi:hypothetical protein